MITHPPANELVSWFRHQFLTRTGIWIRDKDLPALSQALTRRVRAAGASDSNGYQRFLSSDSADAAREWKHVTETLTNGESFFFRDQAQMSLLRNTILPELIARNASRRSLRIWSAGCSTGEEPYSLAILLHELLPDPEAWNLLVLGSDLSEASVTRARRGHYSAWSFRMVDPILQQRYFRQDRDGFHLDARIRRRVTFRQGNLLADVFPAVAAGIHDMDLILCRNVFIYFDTPSIGTVIRKFAQTLAPEGYLMTGHAELHLQEDLSAFESIRFPESVVYRRRDVAALRLPAPTPISPVTTPPVPVATASRPAVSLPLPAPRSANRLATAPTPSVAPALRRTDDRQEESAADLTARARSHADAGRHDVASEYCRRAIRLDSVAFEAYYLLAQITEERGDPHTAKDLLNKVIFLAPQFAPAYLDLSAIYAAEGQIERARTLRQGAEELLRNGAAFLESRR